MREIDRKLDWLRVKDGTPLFWRLSGGERFTRNYGDGLHSYIDYSPTKSLDYYPEFSEELLEISTRLDLCLDMRLSKKESRNFWKTVDKTVKIKRTRGVESFGLKGGKTSYHEGVKGLKLRVYEKGKQMCLEGEEDWIRIEFQVGNPLIGRYLGVADSWDYILEDLLARYTNLEGKKGAPRVLEKVPMSTRQRYEVIAKEVANKGYVDILLELLEKELNNEDFKKNEKIKLLGLT